MMGTASNLTERGWRFRDLETGPHICPACPRLLPGQRPRRRRRSPASKRPALPNVLVIGAEKAGTTSLHRYLNLHPEVAMAEDKELNFFCDPGCLERLDEYAACFDGASPVRGESSPVYSAHPLLPGVPELILAALGDVRLIYVVRDPVERAISDYVQSSRLWTAQPEEEAFANLDHPYHRYMAPGRYAVQVEQYRRALRSERLLIVDQADLMEARRETLRTVFSFLGVDEEFDSPGFDELAMTRTSVRQTTGLGQRLRRSAAGNAVRLLPRWPRGALLAAGSRLTSRAVGPSPPTASDGLRERLRVASEDDVARLRALTGTEFASWQV